MTMLPHKFTLVLGDPGGDGHDKTARYTYDCTHTAKEVSKLYDKSVKKHKLDITGECEDYEDSTLSKSFVDKFNKIFANNPKVLALIGEADDDGTHDIWAGEHAEIYLHIAKLSNEFLHWEDAEEADDLNIGGYGYFE